MTDVQTLLFRFRTVMLLFIIGLVISGVTAFPLLFELKLLSRLLGVDALVSAEGTTWLTYWIRNVRFGLENTCANYPWTAYATDWLAFAHIVIAIFFIGPLINPLLYRHQLLRQIARQNEVCGSGGANVAKPICRV